MTDGEHGLVDFRTEPARYKHWKLSFDGPVATLAMDVREDGGLRPGYELKLNSYDLGVDIELYDAVQRLRFEHPEVGTVVITSGKEKVFSAGANIRMLAASSHARKGNFCKFTNETRNGIEDATERAREYATRSDRPANGSGVALTPLAREVSDDAISYPAVSACIDRGLRLVTVKIEGPIGEQPSEPSAIQAAGDSYWPLAVCRAL